MQRPEKCCVCGALTLTNIMRGGSRYPTYISHARLRTLERAEARKGGKEFKLSKNGRQIWGDTFVAPSSSPRPSSPLRTGGNNLLHACHGSLSLSHWPLCFASLSASPLLLLVEHVFAKWGRRAMVRPLDARRTSLTTIDGRRRGAVKRALLSLSLRLYRFHRSRHRTKRGLRRKQLGGRRELGDARFGKTHLAPRKNERRKKNWEEFCKLLRLLSGGKGIVGS